MSAILFATNYAASSPTPAHPSDAPVTTVSCAQQPHKFARTAAFPSPEAVFLS
jgi:hypothetical protein